MVLQVDYKISIRGEEMLLLKGTHPVSEKKNSILKVIFGNEISFITCTSALSSAKSFDSCWFLGFPEITVVSVM